LSVGRQSGSQRVLINSKIFPEMLLEELSEKRVKISAQTGDSDVPQLFLIQVCPKLIYFHLLPISILGLARLHFQFANTPPNSH
jgi:hypothetical protein